MNIISELSHYLLSPVVAAAVGMVSLWYAKKQDKAANSQILMLESQVRDEKMRQSGADPVENSAN